MRKPLLFFFLFSLTSLAWSGSEYLNVAGWQNCTKAIDQKVYKYFCLPPTKPDGCSAAAWNTLTKGQMLPNCPLCPKK